jgi:plasmid stabilization system protein ParE
VQGNVTFAPEAEMDLAEAYFWYQQRRPGLGDEFLGAVDACVDRICLAPLIYRSVYRNYRRANLHRFPYAVYYESNAEQTTVYAVIHTSRTPEKWHSRLM